MIVQGSLAFIPPLSTRTGAELGELGAQRAAARADRISPGWTANALIFAKGFIATRQNFTAEDLRDAAVGNVETPPDPRAWGTILRTLAKQGLIKRTGYVDARNPQAHACPKAIWETVTNV